MSDKKFVAIIVGVIVLFVGAIIMFGGSETKAGFIGDPLKLQTGEAQQDGSAVQPADRYQGPVDSKVTLIEYADFECPACYGLFPTLKQIEAEYGDKVLFIFRHNPLSALHPNAVAAHRAAEAAGKQDKFWEMHDLLYQNQPSWSRQQSGLSLTDAANVFEGYAQQLELDMDKYRADVASEETFAYIDSHLDSGLKLGVTGTPTLYLNGEEFAARSYEEIAAAIDEILAETNQKPE
jgi:protein-disulfide isomerase